MRYHLALAVIALLASSQSTPALSLPILLRGDANNDTQVNIADSSYITSYLFSGGSAPACMKAADVNDDGQLNVSDSVYLNNFLFQGGPAPPPPYPQCGSDPTTDNLSCHSSACP